MLSNSWIAIEFGTGNPHMSQAFQNELQSRIIGETRNDGVFISIDAPPNALLKSEEYWAGWAFAYYQWYSARSFKSILHAVPIRNIMSMYRPYHEMILTRFAEEMEEDFGRPTRFPG